MKLVAQPVVQFIFQEAGTSECGQGSQNKSSSIRVTKLPEIHVFLPGWSRPLGPRVPLERLPTWPPQCSPDPCNADKVPEQQIHPALPCPSECGVHLSQQSAVRKDVQQV